MGDPTIDRLSLPPGCLFYPSEEQLLCYYLTHKTNNDRRFGFDVIKDVNLYSYNPFDLPDAACFRFGRGGRKRHWYCYVAAGEGGRERRRAGGGYWKRKGKERGVVGAGAEKVVVGTRKSFVFYLGDEGRTAARTDWVMYEYALVGHHEVSVVVCRVLVKLNCRCEGLNHSLSSYGEESFASVRDNWIQHDGNKTSSIGITVKQDDDKVDKKDEDFGVKYGLAGEINDQITAGEAVAVFGVGVELLPHEPVITSVQVRDTDASISLDNLTAVQFISILEEDYIELDDLKSPLPVMDFT